MDRMDCHRRAHAVGACAGLIIIAIEPAALALSGRRTGRCWAAFGLGLSLLILPIAGYYLEFNTFGKNIQKTGWKASGLDWIALSLAGHRSVAEVLNTVCALLTGWSCIPMGTMPRPLHFGGLALLAATILAMAVGLPWKISDSRREDPSRESALRMRRAAGLIALWIGVPIYLFYCVSFPKAASPLGAFAALGLLAWWWWSWRPDLRPAQMNDPL